MTEAPGAIVASSSEPFPVVSAEPSAAEPSAKGVKRHHGLVRAAHWINAVVLLGMIASGLQIYVAFPHFGMKGRVYPVPNPFDSNSLHRGFPEWARLGGWLAGGINWHFALAWPFVVTGLIYIGFLILAGEWRALLFRPRDVRPAIAMQLYYLRLRRDHPPQGKHNALQKAAYTFIVLLGALSAVTGFAIYKPVQLAWLVTLFGGYELARYWHFICVWIFIAFTIVHVALVFLADPASFRAIVTGWYRGKFPSHG